MNAGQNVEWRTIYRLVTHLWQYHTQDDDNQAKFENERSGLTATTKMSGSGLTETYVRANVRS